MGETNQDRARLVPFFLRRQWPHRRTFLLVDAVNRVGTVVEIGTDASLWGLGGWLAIDRIITEYFASQLTQADSAKFGIPLADACGQQVWEALAMPTAIDLWSTTWKQRRIVLKITGGNVTALTLVTKMRPPSPELAISQRTCPAPGGAVLPSGCAAHPRSGPHLRR